MTMQAGHCLPSSDQSLSSLIFCTPASGYHKRGRKRTTYPDGNLDLEPYEIQQLMKNKITRRLLVSATSAIPYMDNRMMMGEI